MNSRTSKNILQERRIGKDVCSQMKKNLETSFAISCVLKELLKNKTELQIQSKNHSQGMGMTRETQLTNYESQRNKSTGKETK